MEEVVKVIAGIGVLISGTMIINLVFGGLDWGRVSQYGLFHELFLIGIFGIVIFVIGIIFMIIGIKLIAEAIKDSEEYK